LRHNILQLVSSRDGAQVERSQHLESFQPKQPRYAKLNSPAACQLIRRRL
jgi:hypothetical protein